MLLREVKKEILKKLKSSLLKVNVYGQEENIDLSEEYIILSLMPRRICNVNPFHKEKLIIVEMKYVSKNKTNDENIEMVDALSDIFSLNLQIMNRVFSIGRMYTKIVENILYACFDIKFMDSREMQENNDEKMRELIMKEE